VSDQENIAKVRAGDRSAFAPLVVRYQGLVFSYLRRFGHDRETARDLMQETFAKALTKLDSLRDPKAFKAWLMQIARNESMAAARKRKETAIDWSAGESEAILAQAQETLEQTDPAEIADRYFDAKRLLAGLQKIPEKYRETLLLRFQGGLTYKEVAATMGITLENTKFRIHHGLKLLRAVLVT
jgi:RNA polymerase sigma-70 factor (ECF subfamily)